MASYLQLIRYKELLFIAFTLLAIKFGFFEPFGFNTALSTFEYSLLVIAVLCIAAGGSVMLYIATNTSKKMIDTIISEQNANKLFVVLNVIGVALGFYIANHIGKSSFSSIFIIISALLYVYATYLKTIPFAGTLTVAILLFVVVIFPGIFDLLPVINVQNKVTQSTIFSILLDYGILAFLLGILSEMIKDCRDMDTDHNTGAQTLPMLMGRDRTAKLGTLLALVPIIAVVLFTYNYLFQNTKAVIYVLVLVIAPLLYFAIKSWSAASKKDFLHLHYVIRFVMFTAVLSIALYSTILK